MKDRRISKPCKRELPLDVALFYLFDTRFLEQGRTSMKTSAILFVSTALFVSACDSPKNEPAKPAPEQTPAKSAAPSAPAATTAAATGSPTPAPAASTSSSAVSGKAGPPMFDGKFPDSDSKPPSVKEWQTDGKVYTVKYSSSLWCETLALREWIRVSCRGKPGAQNQPIGLKVGKAPKLGQHYELSREGVASLVLQPRKGQTSEFTFEWSNWGKRTLTVSFPDAAEKPELNFDKAAPAGKAGLPRCEDVCGAMPIYHNYLSDCAYSCGEGYKCEWWGEGSERTAMCVCENECSD